MIALVGLEKARDAPSVFTRSGVMMSEGVITTMLYQNRLLSVSVGGPLEDEKKIPIRTSTNCRLLIRNKDLSTNKDETFSDIIAKLADYYKKGRPKK